MAKDSRDLIRELEADGWRYIGATGSHHHYRHPVKPGKVTVPHPKRDLHPKTVGSIYRQAGNDGATMSNTAGLVALVHKDHDTSYGVSFPDVPGCISAGDTFEQAMDNAAEALAGHLAAMEADGDPLPKARSLEELREDAGFIEDSGDAVVAFVVPRTERQTTLQSAS